jgi:Ser/Thr protein kinase RdoA (MazF antagonist)
MIPQLQPRVHFKIKDIHKLHFGENKSYMVFSDDKTYVLKCYRELRGFKLTPMQEIELTQKVAALGIATSHYIPFTNGKFINEMDGVQISLQEIIQGHMVINQDERYYFELGRALKKLHTITKHMPIDENLTHYNMDALINQRWQQITSASFVNAEVLQKITYYKDLIQEELGEQINQSQFIHFDAHSGNLIFDQDKVYFIDWEECGFGHPLLDLAVPSAHLMRVEKRDEKLKSLLAGYAGDINPRQLNLFTILKLLYWMGHIPTRTDIIKDPRAIFDRYLGYFDHLNK